MAEPKKNLLGQTSSGKRKANVPSKVKSSSVPGKKNTKVTSLGAGAGTNYAKDKPMQAAVKPYQKYGLPYESRAYKSGAEPAEYAKKKSSTPAKKKVVRTEGPKVNKANREAPSTSVSAPKPSGIQSRKEGKSYSSKDIKMMEAMKKGKKADGTMKASAQRKIARLRRKK